MVTAKKATASKTPAAAPVQAAPQAAHKSAKVSVKAPSAEQKKATAAPKVVAKPKAVKPVKPKKPKLVRDSFTIPKPEYLVLDDLKVRANKLASPAKKSELLRAGIKALAAMSDAEFLSTLKSVPAIKTGRPAKA